MTVLVELSDATETSASEEPGVRIPLTYQRCRWCRSPLMPGRVLCGICGSADLCDEVSGGAGVISRAMQPSRRTGVRCQDCMVVMDEGFSVHAFVIGTPPVVVRPGVKVRIEAIARGTRRAYVIRFPYAE